jgi:hypothetical protein
MVLHPEHVRPARPPSPFATNAVARDWRDIVPLTEAELATADSDIVDDLLAVWVRRGGTWHPTVLTGWRQLGPGYWAARLQTGPDDDPVWVHHKGVALQPVQPQVSDPGAVHARAER